MIGRHPHHILFVNLGLLYLAGEIDIDRFPLRENIQGGGAGLAMTITRLFGAAERKMYFGADRRRIDIENAGKQVAHGDKGPVYVLSVY